MKVSRGMRAVAARAGAAVAAAVLVVAGDTAPGQFGDFGFQQVGGISIDADGIVRNVAAAKLEGLAAERRRALADEKIPAGTGGQRRVSLARIVRAVEEAVTAGGPLPAEVVFLGGLEQITHVFVDPDGHDIILAGPGDTAAVDATGTVVGVRSGRPLMQLEDLVTALRAIDGARANGVRCSIEPTPAGIARLQRFLAAQKSMGPDPQAVFRGMEEALGPQAVTVGGVPVDSRFARVLVAADYRLKRIGMGHEPSGIAALPSYLAMMQPGGQASSLPRFWLEADYDPIGRDADDLAWRISGRRMKCLTETDMLAEGKLEKGAGQADAIADEWCAAMTTRYDAVAVHHPIFAELVNCVDLTVVAALIHGRRLAERAGLDLGPLLDPEKLPLPRYPVPATVPTIATGLKKANRWMVSASGGVQLQPWTYVATTAADEAVGVARAKALAARPADLSGVAWD